MFKLASCKSEAARELALRPQGLRSSTFFKLVFSYVIVVNREQFNFVGFLIIPKFEGLNCKSYQNDREGL